MTVKNTFLTKPLLTLITFVCDNFSMLINLTSKKNVQTYICPSGLVLPENQIEDNTKATKVQKITTWKKKNRNQQKIKRLFQWKTKDVSLVWNKTKGTFSTRKQCSMMCFH